MIRIAFAVFTAVLFSPIFVWADGPCKTFLPEGLRKVDTLERVKQVSAILDELAEKRETFLASGDLVEMFPMLYYHMTRAQFREALSRDQPLADDLLDIIIAFYDAYSINRMLFDERGAKAVEKHWKTYYERAVEQNRAKDLTTLDVFALLLYGVDAHLIDLARTLRYSIPQAKLSTEDLRKGYYGLDPVFYEISKAAVADIAAVKKIDERLKDLEQTFGLGARYAIQSRDRSWKNATGGGPLVARDPQPVVPGRKGSSSFFTLEETEACPKTS
ncbi:MAG: hypothetical protein WBO10_14130 [Pyrinomonadaceae bacterium]